MPKHHKGPVLAAAEDRPDLEAFERRIGYEFTDRGWLKQALKHRSAGSGNMERLEFLGDSVLGLVMAEWLHDHFPDAEEGTLSRMRSHLVCRDGLLRVARKWKIDSVLLVGEGERGKNGLRAPSIAANAVEAVIGSVFKDGGWEAVRALIQKAWDEQLQQLDAAILVDPKTRLQEWTQHHGWGLPVYRTVDHGPNASPRFEAICEVLGKPHGRGRGERKKEAEMKAAEQAWEALH